MVAQLDDLHEPLRSAVAREYGRRLGDDFSAHDREYRPALPAPEVLRMASELVAAGFKALVRKHHPDAGGEHAAMISATAARDYLARVLEHRG